MNRIKNINSKIFNKNKLYEIYRYGVGIIFPPRCVVCDDLLDSPDKMVHEKCMSDLLLINNSHCMHCGRQLALSRTEFCPECKVKISKGLVKARKTFVQGKSLFQYKGVIKETMYRYKYANRREYSDYFAKLIVKRYGDWIREREIEVILPVPMYKRKKQKRGYNQAESLAKAIGRELGLPVDTSCLKRIIDTKPMKELNDKERKKNLQSAFQTKKDIVKYSYILLVDDIYTTGSTADAISEVIYDSGSYEVYFLSVCTGSEI